MKYLALFIASTLFFACGSGKKIHYVLNYDLSDPDVRLILPDTLQEISGQAVLDDSTIACIEDEDGIIYIYDIKGNHILQRITFAGAGDYEEVCEVGKDLFVLRSDGMLFQVLDYASAVPRVESYLTDIPADDNEGLCYDSLHNRLLIACKGHVDKDVADKEIRAIYGFDLKKKELSAEPVFEFDVDDIIDFADDHNVHFEKHEDAPELKFKSSSIAIQPGSQDIFILSAIDHALLIFDHDGKIKDIEALDKKMFNKPEGIAFYPDNDVLITNEGQDKQPTLLRFDYGSE